ncbi:MAG: universal stress protein, partial [Pseudomonadota bacterium]
MSLNQESLNNLLVVADKALSMPQLLEKAERLAGPDTTVHVIQVIYEGVAEISTAAVEDSSRLKTFMLQSAEAALEDELEKARGRFKHLESATLWNARPWEAVLHAAADADADLIIKATGEEEGFGERMVRALRTPDEWNLLRHAPIPVLLVKVAAWPAEPLVLCAVDAFDEAHDELSVKLLGEAAQVAAMMSGALDVVFTYPLFEPWVGELGAVKSYAE